MAAATIKYIDILDYVRKAKEIKDPEVLAEYQARQIESAIELVAQQVREEFHSKDLVTKADFGTLKVDLSIAVAKIENGSKDLEIRLKKEIADLRYETLKFIVWTGVGVVAALSGIFGRALHLF